MKTLLSVFISTFLSIGISAQTVSGKLIDENSQPLPYANVVLLSLSDSTFVTGTISGEDGTFSLATTAGKQLVRISSIGYNTLYRPAQPADMGVIQLTTDAQMLGEVVVKADLPKTRVKGDAMVTTVTGSVLEKAGTGNDLLDKIPGLSANNGSVNVFGSGKAEIYINGRKMRNSSELDQLSSDNIKSVEVLRNPGARYDASVKAVVRIITKSHREKDSVSTTVHTWDTNMTLLCSTSSTSITAREDSTSEVCYSEVTTSSKTTRLLHRKHTWIKSGHKIQI